MLTISNNSLLSTAQTFFIKIIRSLHIPFCCNLKTKSSCQAQSNALDILRKTPFTSWPSSNAEKISCAIDSNWLVQESPVLNPHCFGNIKSFYEKLKTCCYKVTIQTLYRKLGKEKLDDNVGTTFTLFHSEGNLPKRKQFWKIISSGLHIEKPQSFTMPMPSFARVKIFDYLIYSFFRKNNGIWIVISMFGTCIGQSNDISQ